MTIFLLGFKSAQWALIFCDVLILAYCHYRHICQNKYCFYFLEVIEMTKQSYKKKHTRNYSGLGHIIRSYNSSRELYRYIWSLSGDLNLEGPSDEVLEERKKYHRFIAHLYASMDLQVIDKDVFKNHKGYIPVYSRLINQEFGRNFDPHLLEECGIIEIKSHNSMGRKSREYRIALDILEEAMNIEFENMLRRWKGLKKGDVSTDTVNLITGRRSKSRVKSQLDKIRYGIRNTNYPKLIRDSINALEPCPFNPKYVKQWVKKLKNKFIREFRRKSRTTLSRSHENQSAEKEYLKAAGRYCNDRLSMNTISFQEPEPIPIRSEKGDPLLKYRAAYSIQNSGRVTEIHGGFQSASQFFKQRFFRHVPNIYNYDLKNSQALILLQELKACKLKCHWLKSYLSDPDAKKKYARKVGIPVEIWKDCFYVNRH